MWNALPLLEDCLDEDSVQSAVDAAVAVVVDVSARPDIFSR